MKRKLLSVALLMCGYLSYSQVGVGTLQPSNSAILDLKSNNRGLLIPKIPLKSLLDAQSINGGSPELGLLVFNTTKNDNIRPGYYYWGKAYDGTGAAEHWVALGDDLSAVMNKTKFVFSVEKEQFILSDQNGKLAAIPLIDLQIVTNLTPDPKEAGTYTYVNELGKESKITVLQDVINNFKEIITNDKVIKEIVNALKGKFGNVVYDVSDNKFYYLDDKGVKQLIQWSDLDTTNKTFQIEKYNGIESLVVTDSKNGKIALPVADIAKNSTFITELVTNQKFVDEITNNQKFIQNIINKLKGVYGNVVYQGGSFYYYDANGKLEPIKWEDLNAINERFELLKTPNGDFLAVTDSDRKTVQVDIREIAKSSFFVNELSENNSFITNIVNKLKGKYGNVYYDGKDFYTLNPETGAKTLISWKDLDTVNEKFTIEKAKDASGKEVDSLVITDSKGEKVSMPVADIAKNETFVTELTENKFFINKITNNNEFVTNIVNKLKGKYGNVHYENNKFYTLDPETGAKTPISWKDLDTVNEKFTIEKAKDAKGVEVDSLVITDSKGEKVSMPVADIAKNSTFITELTENKEFITKITNNNDFVTNIVNKLKGKYGNVYYENNKFYTLDPETGAKTLISWKDLDTVNAKFAIGKGPDAAGKDVDSLVITDSKGGKVSMPVADIASNQIFIDNITNNESFVTNIKKIQAYGSIVDQLDTENTTKVKYAKKFNNGKANSADVLLTETLTVISKGKDNANDKLLAYNYQDETGKVAKVQITVASDVINDFSEIIKNENVKNELNNFITNATGSVTVSKDATTGNITITYKNGKETATLDLTTEIRRVQYFGSITNTEANATNKNGKGFNFNNGKAEAGSYSESVTGFTTDTKKVTLDDSTQGDAIVYKYKDEATNTHELNITEDVSKTFKTIINKDGNKTLIENLVTKVAPTVSMTNIAANKTSKNGAGFSLSDGKKEIGKYGESVTGITKNTVKLDLADGTKGDGVEYEYLDESGNTQKISVTQDVANTFQTIINQGGNKTYIENIIKNLIKVEGSKVTVEDRNGDKYLIVVNGNDKKEVNLSQTAKDNSYLASLVLKTTGNVGNVKGGFIFKDGKNTATVDFAETLTPIERKAPTGSPVTTPSGDLTYYVYKDETGKENNITVSQDVSNDFKTIVNQVNNKTVIEEISQGANLYSTTKETAIGKFNDKTVMRYVVEMKQPTAFTTIELPKAIDGMILEVTLIQKDTNSITRGVISKQVNGDKTTLAVGMVGTIITSNPAGDYCIIVEYVKK
ncbi:MAG: hypothetical protein LBE34_02110 [Flavobacteriaceae bacterium]|nr:hypothetical protein [Flavobacteriaceae bacterium]